MSDPIVDSRKPLPFLNSDQELPPPPSYTPESSLPPRSPPLPPPKMASEPSQDAIQFDLVRSDTLSTVGSLDTGFPGASAPTTPTTPTAITATPESKAKKNNPLVDLIETEKVYVEQLTGIVRKIASAWSRSNLPPAELDSIFRSIEAICKANRSLLSKLKDIGTNPSSPKALGDLLMRWVDDLEGPYTAYCYHYCAGFDVWDPILSNPHLQPILIAFSEATPPPPALVSGSDNPVWTLDSLFLIPKFRLRYYKKLYGRLLKSTAPGRSDYRLLVGALEKLGNLLATLEERANLKAGTILLPTPGPNSVDEVVIDMRNQRLSEEPGQSDVLRTSITDMVTDSADSSVRGSSISSSERFSRDTASTFSGAASRNTMTTPLVDLERRLATDRTLDIFTMTPKVVKLQISPPTLKYSRSLRFSVDVVIRFTPRSTGVEIVHQNGHIFLLSDLFLICEKMSQEERSQREPGGSDMWLCYPPLAGKVLRVSEVAGKENALEVHILKKETLLLETESPHARDFMMTEFKGCIEFASAVSASAIQPPPLPVQIPDGQALAVGPAHMNRPPRGVPPNARTGHEPPPNPGVPLALGVPGPMNRLLESGPMMLQRGLMQPAMVHPGQGNPAIMHPSHSNPAIMPDGQMPLSASRGAPVRDPLASSVYPPRSIPAQPLPPGPWGNPQIHIPPDPSLRAGPSRNPPGAFPYGPGMGPNQPFHAPPQAPGFPPHGVQDRPMPEPMVAGGLRKSPSTPSLMNPPGPGTLPALPPPNGYQHFVPTGPANMRNDPYGSMRAPQPRPMLPSALNVRAVSMSGPSFNPSPPSSPVEERIPAGPVTSTISAQMKCKVFLQQQHAQWKSLGPAKLKLYKQHPTNVKQLVVEADNKGKSILISTIVLTDGVERVGKTGVAVELSDKGARTGIVYMLQLRNETSARGLFDSLLEGSDRAGRG